MFGPNLKQRLKQFLGAYWTEDDIWPRIRLTSWFSVGHWNNNITEKKCSCIANATEQICLSLKLCMCNQMMLHSAAPSHALLVLHCNNAASTELLLLGYWFFSFKECWCQVGKGRMQLHFFYGDTPEAPPQCLCCVSISSFLLVFLTCSIFMPYITSHRITYRTHFVYNDLWVLF